MRTLFVSLLAAGTVVSAQSNAPRQQEIDNVAAFARLYGVVRYFYPGDAAASLDWNRFAVLGVERVRNAPNAAALEKTLEELFAPLGPGIDIAVMLPPAPAVGSGDPTLIAWRYVGPGGMSTGQSVYTAGRLNRAGPPRPANPNAFVALAQVIPATPYRGKAIRLRARVRVTDPDAAGAAGLWLRVDRPNQTMGFFDNMQNRPVRSAEWREYTIEGMVADDAINIVLGPLASGPVTAEYDAFELTTGSEGGWTPVAIANPGFEDVNGTAPAAWQGAAPAPGAQVTIEANGAAEGQRYLRLTGATATTTTPTPQGTAPVNAHVDVDLASGLRARVRLSLSDAEARSATSALDALRAAVAAVPPPQGRSDLAVRLADVITAWNVLRHFYPYWSEAAVDWDSRLRPQLALAWSAEKRTAHREALATLVAEARDGHGNVTDTASGERRGLLPILISVVQGRPVITASAMPDEAPVGSTVTSIGGIAISERLAAGLRLSSGSAQWRQSTTARALSSCVRDAAVRVGLQPETGPAREVTLTCGATPPPVEKRPPPITEVTPGVWYVDITRATAAQVTPALPELAGAAGLVFDLRGYPTDVGTVILRHLIEAPESDRWMHVPHITGPFGQVERWQSVGWNLQPAAPQLPARRVFLTDGRAISYAESVMGYVKDRKLATVIGAPTAGTNGNVVSFVVPGGFAITFTGMRVTRHDGQTPFHLVGVTPDIAVEPTLAGVRAGRDELLERALEQLRMP